MAEIKSKFQNKIATTVEVAYIDTSKGRRKRVDIAEVDIGEFYSSNSLLLKLSRIKINVESVTQSPLRKVA